MPIIWESISTKSMEVIDANGIAADAANIAGLACGFDGQGWTLIRKAKEIAVSKAKLVDATKSTLRNIAGLTRREASQLEPSDSLADDLGYSEAKFKQLAVWQRRVGDRIRDDDKKTRILAAELAGLDNVASVVALLLARALGQELVPAALESLIVEAKGELQ